MIIGNFYRSPSHSPNLFIDHLNKTTEYLLKRHSNKDIVIVGDTNIDFLKHTTYAPAQHLLNILSQNGLVPTISRPTRITDRSISLIDHIYTNAILNIRTSGVLTNPFADHLATYLKLGYIAHKNNTTQEHYNHVDYSDANIKKFNSLLENSDWSSIDSANDPDTKFDNFHSVFSNCYTECFPVTLKKCNNRKAEGKPWIQPWLQEACNRKNKLYSLYMKNPTLENKLAYKKWVEKQVYKNKKRYYSDQITKHSNESRKQWKIINDIISNRKPRIKITKIKIGNNTVTNNSEISETFNDYFCSIARKLKDGIPKTSSSTNTCTPKYHQNTMYLEPCTISEIAGIIHKLKNSSTSDYNVTVIKQVNHTISKILCNVINSSLSLGSFPYSLKIAKVVPIHKSGSRTDVSNYRPISLLSLFSKVYEKVMYSRLTSFFSKENIIYPRQYGFRAQHSCEHALLDAQNTILNALNNKQIALLLLIDFSKAFDMVDHVILLDKLQRYGVRGIAHKWLESYLSNRKQFVTINNSNSPIQKLDYGVPQGSILGPLLFIIYINDIHTINKEFHFILYADDANIIIVGDNISIIKAKVSALLIQLSTWVDENALKLNVKKTHYMIFSNLGTFNLTLRLGTQIIEQSQEERFLGVIMDNNLTWKAHRIAIAQRISRNSGVLFRARHHFNNDTLKLLYFSFIQSHLIFCSSIWGLGSKNSLEKIFVAQKKALRAISFTNLYTIDKITKVYSYGHTKNIFNRLEILSVHNLILLQAMNQMHKLYIKRAPAHTQTLFTAHNPPINQNQITSIDTDTYQKLTKKGILAENLIHLPITSLFFEYHTPRLKRSKTSLKTFGPLAYNYFCNKINKNNMNIAVNSNPQIQTLTPKSFSLNIKKILITEQKLGDPILWEPENMPAYKLVNLTISLRSLQAPHD